ncbi:MAG: bifunctional diaminohydroxyphosphoribosylaminopyrimidine deaminase/5-amino-6-(5-phosphoribosylamino)uracil reductase RibD [Microbacteriaceae bacterium]|nr:bifunctional diaminohydroxyphosphoribosylaminopyrimidine deaminase/5-amino-6-(5-phosphoribosylamino)uracil reductase RibD [Microbacteriaceae bacterium]
MDVGGGYGTAMRRALELAAHGPLTGGNPRVGCVLLDAGGGVIAEGWHRGAGTPHAEVDALSRLPAGLAPHTAVVTLEPCNHIGRTGPCAEALIAAGVQRVVYAVADPGAASSGGADRLRAAGVEVVPGVLADETEAFLHPWLTATRRGRPWVTLKWAAALDGRVAAADGTSQWITGPAARLDGHRLRGESDAIVTGTGTVLADDPSLTARDAEGVLLPHQPVPVVVGARPVPSNAALRRHPAGLVEAGPRPLAGLLDDLWRLGLARVLVEAGPVLTSAFLRAGLVDELAVYVAPKLLGGPGLAVGDLGIATIGDALDLDLHDVRRLGPDLALSFRFQGQTGVRMQYGLEEPAVPENGR